MLQRSRDLSAPGVWFWTVRVAEVGVVALLVGALLEARYAWTVGAQFSARDAVDVTIDVSLMQRVTGMALFGGYRMPVSLLAVALAMTGLLVVLHRCQPVSHTRVLRWEWLTLWGVATLLAFLASAVGVAALFADNPYASPDPSVVSGDFGPGFREQVIGNLSWPLAALLLLLPLAVWWARLPDMDDLEDALAAMEDQRIGRERPSSGPSSTDGVWSTDGPSSTDATWSPAQVPSAVPGSTSPVRIGRSGRPSGGRSTGRGGDTGVDTGLGPRRDTGLGPRLDTGRDPRRDGRHDGDQDAIRVDDVEQIEPVERLRPRGRDLGDGSSSSGYDGYFRR
jgi:hypothetical protein